MPFRIDHAHREVLRTEAIATLADLEEIHFTVQDDETEFAKRLRGRYAAVKALLGAIGGEPRPTSPAFRIDMPGALLGLALTDLMGRAGDRLASVDPNPSDEVVHRDCLHCRAVLSIGVHLLREIGAE